MSERVEVCRKKVTECQRLAMAASDPAIRQVYLDLAQQWRELAEHAEQLAAVQSQVVNPTPLEDGAPSAGDFRISTPTG